MSFGEFENNELVVDAVTRNLEVIGEAAKHVPPETRAGYDAVDWQKVAGFRDIAIHAYFDVDVEIVWTIASKQLGDLKHLVIRMLHDLGNQAEV